MSIGAGITLIVIGLIFLLGVVQVDVPLIDEYTLGILLVLGGIAAIVLTMTLGRRGTTTTRVVERPAVSEPRFVERQIIERDVNDPNLP